MFEVHFRDCIARVGKLNDKVITPNILFILSKRFEYFEGSEALLATEELESLKFSIADLGSKFYPSELKKQEYVIPADIPYPLSCSELFENYSTDKICLVQAADKVDKRAEIYVLANSVKLFANEKKFVSTLTRLREKVGYQKLIYTPAVGLPNQYALLFYLGIDFIDSLQLILATKKNFFLTPDGKMKIEAIEEQVCTCKYCQSKNLLGHNYAQALSELKNIRNRIKAHNLRELVEVRAHTEPSLVSILRELDYRYYSFQEPYFPIVKKSLLITSRESFFRPDVLRWAKRLIERYKKPESAKLLLLLPCSAKKPYSFSKSHSIFRSALLDIENPKVVHEVVVTSPLGLVPRELELFYPAQHYEIPVTGDWEAYEIKLVNELLEWLVKNNRYEAIINHTGLEFVQLDAVNTCLVKPTAQGSIEKLRQTLAELTASYPLIPREKRAIENMLVRARFQFGKAGEKLVTDCKIKGKYPNLRIMKGNTQLGMLTGERGLISLTLEGAKYLALERAYCVEIADFIPKGDVFAVGVINAAPEIRIGDDVAVLHEDELRAVGRAQMSAEEMIESNRGIAVKVRAKVRK